MCGLSGDDLEGPAFSSCMSAGLPAKNPIVAILPGLGAHPLADGSVGNGARAGDSNRGDAHFQNALPLLEPQTGRGGRDVKISQPNLLELERGNCGRERGSSSPEDLNPCQCFPQ